VGARYVARAGTAHGFLARLAATENTPPLFYLVLSFVPGDASAWLRLPALVPGVLLSPVLYWMLRGRLGDLAAALSALLIAVAPFLVTYSDLARGFMLADLALLVAMWALLRLLDRETIGGWVVFVVAGVVAIYTEYDSAIVLAALGATGVWIGRRRWASIVTALGLVFASIAPWIGQIVRAQHQIGHTKLSPMNASLSLRAVRDLVVTLVFGENGGTSRAAGRWLLCVLLLGLLAVAAIVLLHGWPQRDPRGCQTLQVLSGTAALSVVGYALAGVIGIHVFSQRYLTILVVLISPVFFAALIDLNRTALVAAAVVALTGLGVVNAWRRTGSEYEPSFAPVRAAAVAAHPQTILTNTPIVLYYLQAAHPVLDRPYNLGPGRTSSCRRPCVVIDDMRVPGGTPRSLTWSSQSIGPFVLRRER
jgi:Dolichyl-phosphate-mannose-protein mannosyltransferase